MMYRGSEPILYVSLDSFSSTNMSNFERMRRYWWSNHFPLVNNEPFLLSWVVPDNWNKLDEEEEILSRILEIQAVTENHILKYEYQLKK